MKGDFNDAKGFTLVELLVVVGIISLLAALLLPVLSAAKERGRRAGCLSNLRQINVAVRMYAEDSSDAFPPSTNQPPASFSYYTQLMKSYVGLTGASPAKAKIFACPADRFYYGGDGDSEYFSQSLHDQSLYYYSSYAFNGGNFLSGKPPVSRWPGIAGTKLSSVRAPVKTVLTAEFSALLPFSWHQPGGVAHFNNAMNMVSFVDGHASFIKIYWNAARTNGIEAWQYDPPAGYDYQWRQ